MNKHLIVILVLGVLFVVGTIVMLFTYKNITSDAVVVNYNNSFFDTFEIENEKVVYHCIVKIHNNTHTKQKFRVNASSEKDVGNHLLKAPEMIGYNELWESDFTITADEERIYTIHFVGQWGGAKQKVDRNIY